MTRQQLLDKSGVSGAANEIVNEYDTLFMQVKTMTPKRAINTLAKRWHLPREVIKDIIDQNH